MKIYSKLPDPNFLKALSATLVLMVVSSLWQPLFSQNVNRETLEWSASGFRDNSSGEDFSNGCQFITEGNKKITWVQDSGKSRVDWNVYSTTGTWADVSKDGRVIHRFRDGQLSGEITMQRTGGVYKIDVNITGGTDEIKLTYTVTGVKKV